MNEKCIPLFLLDRGTQGRKEHRQSLVRQPGGLEWLARGNNFHSSSKRPLQPWVPGQWWGTNFWRWPTGAPGGHGSSHLSRQWPEGSLLRDRFDRGSRSYFVTNQYFFLFKTCIRIFQNRHSLLGTLHTRLLEDAQTIFVEKKGRARVQCNMVTTQKHDPFPFASDQMIFVA